MVDEEVLHDSDLVDSVHWSSLVGDLSCLLFSNPRLDLLLAQPRVCGEFGQFLLCVVLCLSTLSVCETTFNVNACLPPLIDSKIFVFH